MASGSEAGNTPQQMVRLVPQDLGCTSLGRLPVETFLHPGLQEVTAAWTARIRRQHLR